MKNLIASLLMFAMICTVSISLVGCGGTKKTEKKTETPSGSTEQKTEAKKT